MPRDVLGQLQAEVVRFRAWADTYPAGRRSGEWETEYPHWEALRAAFATFIDTTSYHDWSEDAIQLLLYAVARDNEVEELAHLLGEHPCALIFLADQGLQAAERDAAWQLASQLGTLDLLQAEPLLVRYVEHADEYVRRRALLALGRLGSSQVEALAAKAWDSGEESQRIAALCALEDVGSSRIREYAARDEALSTPGLARYAAHIREAGTLRGFRVQGVPVIESAIDSA
jgi:hypothetical protein